MSIAPLRLRKEIEALVSTGGDHGLLQLISPDYNKNLRDADLLKWQVLMPGPEASIYKGERYLLDIEFPLSYPMDPPKLKFCVTDEWKAPMYEHVYSNGIVCMSLLSKSSKRGDWSPAVTTLQLLMGLQSMLTSAKTKQVPRDNDSFVQGYGKQAENWDDAKVRWAYHDDKC